MENVLAVPEKKRVRTLVELLSSAPDLRRELQKEEVELAVMALMGKKDAFPMTREQLQDDVKRIEDVMRKNSDDTSGIGAMKILINHLSPDLKFSRATVAICLLFCDRPGTCALWAHTLNYETMKSQYEFISPDTLMRDLFPNGVPTDEAYSLLWAEHKAMVEDRRTTQDAEFDEVEVDQAVEEIVPKLLS